MSAFGLPPIIALQKPRKTGALGHVPPDNPPAAFPIPAPPQPGSYPQRVGVNARQAVDGLGRVGGAIGARLQAEGAGVGRAQSALLQARNTAGASFAAGAPAVPKPAYAGPLLAPSTQASALPTNAYNFMDGPPRAVTPATHLVSPATPVGPMAGRVAAPLRRPPAYNDGSGASFQTGAGGVGQLPAGVAVVRQKNGVNAFGATGASVAGATGVPQHLAPLAAPNATATAPNAPVPLPTNLPRPPVAGAYDEMHLSRDQRDKAVSDLDSLIFRAGLGSHSRSGRELLASLASTKANLVDGGGRIAADVAGGDRDAAAKYGVAGVEQQGENQRALLGDANTRDIATQKDQGDTTRTYFASLADLNKPSTITGSDGSLLRVTGSSAAPVVGPDGLPVQTWDAKPDRPDANSILTAYTAQKKALDDAAATTLKPADYTALDASPIGEAYRRALTPLQRPTSLAAPPPADHIAKLRANPHWSHFFDQRYGKGAAARYLKGGSQ